MIITFPCAVPQVKSISSMQRPTIHLPSLQYFKPCLLLVATLAIYFAIYCYYLLLLLLSSLSYYCYHLSFVASKYISGAVELTTQLLKLINNLWLPVCRINKLGYSYPRRLSRSLTVEGYHLVDHRGLSLSSWVGLTVVLPIVILVVLPDWFLAATEPVGLFAVGVPTGNFHHSRQGHVACSPKLHIQLSIADAFLESAHRPMLGNVFHRVMQSGPPLNIVPQ